MTDAAAPVSNLFHLLTASGVLAPLDDRRLAIDRRYHGQWARQ